VTGKLAVLGAAMRHVFALDAVESAERRLTQDQHYRAIDQLPRPGDVLAGDLSTTLNHGRVPSPKQSDRS
jgi:hypothetical protein